MTPSSEVSVRSRVARLARGVALAMFALVVGVLSACATSTGPTPDMAAHRICPDNPGNCAGTCCGDACIDTSIDVRNCGGCNTQCPAGTVCAQGRCGCLPTGTPCGSGQSCCGNLGCKSLASDINNCGACGKSCGSGSTCENSKCKCGGIECAAGQVCCDGTCAATCAGTPDMAVAACACASGCPLSGVCVGPNCCLEDALIAKSCSPDAKCLLSNP